MWRHPIHDPASTGRLLIGGVIAAVAVSVAVIMSADGSARGASRVWPWLLTGIQVLSLWSAGRARWWGWLLGGAVQLPWIAYAVMTNQIGFIPGCVISTSVQIYSFLHNSPPQTPMEVLA